jgi:hypothetical protein
MGGAFVAATIVSLVQFLRVRDRRLLLVATMFACQSQALSREWYDVWRDVFQAGVCSRTTEGGLSTRRAGCFLVGRSPTCGARIVQPRRAST